MSLKSNKLAVRNYLMLTFLSELQTLQNAEVSAAKNHGKNYIKVRPLLVHHLLRNCLL